SDVDSSILPQLAIAALGATLFAVGMRSRRARALLQVTGLALVGVAAEPIASAFVRRAGERRRQIELSSFIEIERPIEEVFAFFKDFENFPRVFGGLHSVIDYQDG